MTFATLTIGSLALVGVFPLAGFWSKDEILADAWEDRPWVFGVALVGVVSDGGLRGPDAVPDFGGEYRGGERSGA